MRSQWFAGRNSKSLIVPVLLVGVLTGIAPVGASASTCVAWTGAQPPSPGSSSNGLGGVATLSPCNAWAVGEYSNGTAEQTLVLHWNGSSWTQKPSPNVGTHYNDLKGVAAVSSTNVWAVGLYWNGTAERTLVLHWNGTAWTHVKSPNVGGASINNDLYGVTAISSTNVWAVGDYFSATSDQTLVLHWNGTAWKHVTSPNVGGSSNINALTAVASSSRTNVWAVGHYFNGTAERTLVLHWNGTAWKHVTTPNVGTHTNVLYGVTAASSTNAWAVGEYFNGTAAQTLVLHWKGTAWKHVTSPNPGGSSHNNDLSGVAATSSTNAWAVGNFSKGTASQTLLLHWNGTAWKHMTSPNPGGSSNGLNAVAASSSTNVWAVGSYSNGGPSQTLALHCC